VRLLLTARHHAEVAPEPEPQLPMFWAAVLHASRAGVMRSHGVCRNAPAGFSVIPAGRL